MKTSSAKVRRGTREIDFFKDNWSILLLFAASVAVLILMWVFNWIETKYTLSLLVAVITFLAFSFVKLTGDIRADIRGLHADLSNSHIVEIIDEQQFYLYMMAAITSAERTIDVTRLDQINPSEASQEIKDYYETAIDVVRKRHVKFRRIVKIGNIDVLEWVIELIEELRDCRHFSMASLKESDTTTLSIQIFDRKELLFLQLDSGEARQGTRFNMRIRGEELAKQFSTYYNKIWERNTIPIKDANRIYWDNLIGFAQRLLTQAKQRNADDDADSIRKLPVLINKLNDLRVKYG